MCIMVKCASAFLCVKHMKNGDSQQLRCKPQNDMKTRKEIYCCDLTLGVCCKN